MTTITLGALEGEVPEPYEIKIQHRYKGETEWKDGAWPDPMLPGTIEMRAVEVSAEK